MTATEVLNVDVLVEQFCDAYTALVNPIDYVSKSTVDQQLFTMLVNQFGISGKTVQIIFRSLETSLKSHVDTAAYEVYEEEEA